MWHTFISVVKNSLLNHKNVITISFQDLYLEVVSYSTESYYDQLEIIEGEG